MSMDDFPTVHDGETVTPVMDDYRMMCCDCDLVHKFRFRAIRVTEHLPDGTFRYDVLDPTEYRVQLIGSRPEQQPPWPSRPRRGPGQPMCELCPGVGVRPSWRNLWQGCCGACEAMPHGRSK